MAITFNPQVMASKVSFKGETKPAAAPAETPAAPAAPAIAEKPKGSKMANFASKVSYAWINTAENVKGFVKGVLAAVITGTAIAGLDAVITGINKVKTGELEKYSQILKESTKAMGVVGKVVAPGVGALILGGYMVSARLNANKRTANVDHQLYTGHRAEKK